MADGAEKKVEPKRKWLPSDDDPVCEQLLSGKREPWPDDLSDWHARRRAGEKRADLITSARIDDHEEVCYAVERVLRAIDRKYVGHEVRQRFAENVADWLFGIPQPPAHGVCVMRDTIPEACFQAVVAGAWLFQKLNDKRGGPLPATRAVELFDGVAHG